MTESSTPAPVAPAPRKPVVTLPRLLMLGVAAGALYGALDYATDTLVAHTKNFLDNGLIKQSAQNKIVFTYDAVERAGLLQAAVKNPRFVMNTPDGATVVLRTSLAKAYPWGLRTARVIVPDEVELAGEAGRLLLLGNHPLKLQFGAVNEENLPSEFQLSLPSHTVLRVMDAQNQRTGSYVMDAKQFVFTLTREGQNKMASTLQSKNVSVGQEEATQPVARYADLYLSGAVHQHDKLQFDVAQKMALKKLEVELPESKDSPKGSFSMPLDAGWDSKAQIELFLVSDEGEQSAPPSMQYLVKSLGIKEGYLTLAAMPLLKFSGEMGATRQDPQPTGQLAVVFGGLKTVKTMLGAGGDVGKTYLGVVDALEKQLAALGKRVNDDAIEVVLSRKAGEAIKVGALDYQQAMTQLVQAAMGASGVNSYIDAPGIGKAGIGQNQPGEEAEHPVELPHSLMTAPIPPALSSEDAAPTK